MPRASQKATCAALARFPPRLYYTRFGANILLGAFFFIAYLDTSFFEKITLCTLVPSLFFCSLRECSLSWSLRQQQHNFWGKQVRKLPSHPECPAYSTRTSHYYSLLYLKYLGLLFYCHNLPSKNFTIESMTQKKTATASGRIGMATTLNALACVCPLPSSLLPLL